MTYLGNVQYCPCVVVTYQAPRVLLSSTRGTRAYAPSGPTHFLGDVQYCDLGYVRYHPRLRCYRRRGMPGTERGYAATRRDGGLGHLRLRCAFPPS
eukprot:3703092-Rhodomonas_salina.2